MNNIAAPAPANDPAAAPPGPAKNNPKVPPIAVPAASQARSTAASAIELTRAS